MLSTLFMIMGNGIMAHQGRSVADSNLQPHFGAVREHFVSQQ